MAPEMIKNEGHDLKADIWALGILCYQLIVGTLPFKARNIETLVQVVS